LPRSLDRGSKDSSAESGLQPLFSLNGKIAIYKQNYWNVSQIRAKALWKLLHFKPWPEGQGNFSSTFQFFIGQQ
jgi:hypothetical protein